jgi:chromate reductase, NAD(P)H dehydrogenase (quinone)
MVRSPDTSAARIIRILTISGSLRQVSSNTSLLQAAIELSPANVEMRLYLGLGDLPHFNPDIEPAVPPALTDLRSQLRWADALVISSPEYAHGVPGVLKNALDWLVSGEEFAGKPVALFNASPRAVHAQAALIEIVTTMAGKIIPNGCITVPLLGKNLDSAGIIADVELAEQVRQAIIAVVDFVERTNFQE